MLKICTKCKELKDLELDFSKRKAGKLGRVSSCKECNKKACKSYRERNPNKSKEDSKIYYQKNKEKELLRAKKYREKNKDKILEKRKLWCKENPRQKREQWNKWFKVKIKTCPKYSAEISYRSRLRAAIRCNAKSGKAVEELGCTISEFKKYFESLFQEGMSWDNWGVGGWEIDHIKPLKNFNLLNDEDVKTACHFTNLQPLWPDQNRDKYLKTLKGDMK